MLAGILPSGVESAEVFGGECDEGELFPEEAALVAGATAPIMPGPSGAPRWPPGIVGSMTHCDGYRAAAVGRADTFAAIGIDAEPDEMLPGSVLPRVASESERTALAGLAAVAPGFCWDRILFSAKESVFKAWFPATGRRLGFSDAEVELLESGSFAAHLLVPGPVVGGRRVATYDGFWAVSRGLVITAVAAPASCP